MGELINQVAKERGISNILDLGSGQGYLARVLAYQHGLNVLAVDKSEVQIRGAEKFDSRISRGFTGQDQTIQPGTEPNLKHLTQMITPDNISDVLTGHEQDARHNDQWLITGLHACGDLSTLILRLFAQDKSKVKALVNVGCCYHCLTEEEDEGSCGFPMSDFVKAQGYRMGTTNRVLACHSPSRWYQEKADTQKAFELHFYRALMQSLLSEKGLASPKTTVVLGRIKKRKDFGAYVTMALQKLGLAPETIPVEEAEARFRQAKQQQEDKKLMALWTVRALLGPLLESIVLVDRWMYLKQNSEKEDEQSWGAWMYPLFDASASPRNVVLVAYKQ
ncbi:methyltransferase domain-domain-containing protein [Syncephalastrum racemosum]|uniref:Methyltransferase domain-domain-containing protein n=1 Tax=Syncephalastrum racemosum TaxID=13706 RepID=A0A1X2HBM8_SYNRA|nr:methyltransferase domain-domain-containing protein [Syncephalastrum racemosum]